ncbi:Hypothetical predicted protein [Paramuricea clavata]|uniref:Uncharacterized protein n=1 Tax=Paramuricea clavata TaxID=317549 RepID=A0A6S7GXC3_PARCT|nr:Hypothetical predicted protein [Paramuricea clavata]
MLNLVKFEGHLNNLSGYIFEICKSLGESQVSKKCFISCTNLDSAKKFKNALNQALADCGGVFWDDIKDYQLQSLLRDMSREYFINGGKSKKSGDCHRKTRFRKTWCQT